MNPSKASLDHIFESLIQTLAVAQQLNTVLAYRVVVRRFLRYLHDAFPQVRRLTQLRRDPHLLGWMRYLCDQDPRLSNQTRRQYQVLLRRLLEDFAANGHPIQPELIRREDLPPKNQHLPKPLSLEDDQQLQQELRRTDDLLSNGLLLTRFTGIRIGECIDLPPDCLRQLGPNQWALYVPLGKLHTERLVPADAEVRRFIARILALRPLAPPEHLARSEGLLLPRGGDQWAAYHRLREALADAAARAGCSTHVTPHRLRHSYATEMLRLGVSLPALMQLLGHKDIHMTLRYVQVTQQDLQREFHLARQNAPHRVPALSIPEHTGAADLPTIHQALASTRHLLEMYRRGFTDETIRRKLQRLDRRLLAVADQLVHITIAEK
jgi:site-specific recombinase XerD